MEQFRQCTVIDYILILVFDIHANMAIWLSTYGMDEIEMSNLCTLAFMCLYRL